MPALPENTVPVVVLDSINRANAQQGLPPVCALAPPAAQEQSIASAAPEQAGQVPPAPTQPESSYVLTHEPSASAGRPDETEGLRDVKAPPQAPPPPEPASPATIQEAPESVATLLTLEKPVVMTLEHPPAPTRPSEPSRPLESSRPSEASRPVEPTRESAHEQYTPATRHGLIERALEAGKALLARGTKAAQDLSSRTAAPTESRPARVPEVKQQPPAVRQPAQARAAPSKELHFAPWAEQLEHMLAQRRVAMFVDGDRGCIKWLPRSATLATALAYMKEQDVSGVPLYEGDQPVALLELADIAAYVSTSRRPSHLEVTIPNECVYCMCVLCFADCRAGPVRRGAEPAVAAMRSGHQRGRPARDTEIIMVAQR